MHPWMLWRMLETQKCHQQLEIFGDDFTIAKYVKTGYIDVGDGCWRRNVLATKCVGENFEMFATVSAVFVTNILYLLTLASGSNNQKMSPISKFCS